MKRLLIIDDEEHIREIASLSLELTLGWSITTASGGLEGIAQAEGTCPDAILLDVMMPGVDGPATFRILRERSLTSAIPVIFLTAKVQAADRTRLEKFGAEGIIAKPFDPNTLGLEIAQILRWDVPAA